MILGVRTAPIGLSTAPILPVIVSHVVKESTWCFEDFVIAVAAAICLVADVIFRHLDWIEGKEKELVVGGIVCSSVGRLVCRMIQDGSVVRL